MKLLIVESPAKAKTIEKYLDGKFTVRASVGHVRDLPKSNKKAVDIENGFKPHYEIAKGKEKVVDELKKLANKADEVILATDPDREGEAIAWHIAEVTDLKKPKRIVFHEITKDAVNEALLHPRLIDTHLRKAQEARRVLDRLVGYDLSGIIWKKVRYGLSAGRVQSPALRIIMEREREIRAFKSETYWVIKADTKTNTGDPIPFISSVEPKEEAETKRIVETAKKADWIIASIEEAEAKRSPRPPFITSTLQQAASSRLGLPPSRTMGLAQRLYEAGLITYMRTDSTNLSAVAHTQIKAAIEHSFGKELYQEHTYTKKSKNAQEAHEAIRPTNFSIESAGSDEAQKRLYKLIWQRTVASQMKDARVSRTRITANVAKGAVPDFNADGTRVIFPGWLLADTGARGEDVELPKVKEGDKLTVIDVTSEEKHTQPPPHYSEAGLVKELEKRGIGRPSTYASIIKTLVDRGYVTKEQRALIPTDTGDVVSSFLENNFAEYISDGFTASMEDDLDQIASGEKEYEKTLSAFYKPFLKDIKSKEKLAKATNLGDADPSMKCPVCGSSMIIKLGKSGKFLSCDKFPTCVGARMMNGDPIEGPKETGELCPDCGNKLVERMGRFGKFISCSTYPKCKFIKKDPEQEAKEKTGVKCPMCGTGEIVQKGGRFGPFFACNNYPKCNFTMKAKPTGRVCGECGSLMMEGTKTIPERCSNKTCIRHKPAKKTPEETK